jgi:hypothetical protein
MNKGKEMMDKRAKAIDILFKYECENECCGEPDWEELVTGILKSF